MNDDLKPCPFCGRQPEFLQIGNDSTKTRGYNIECRCGIEFKQRVLFKTLEWLRIQMVAAWNTRTKEASNESPD